MKGRLKDRPLEAVLGALRSRDASGVLTLELKPVKRQICLLRGFVCLAVSNLREERLGAYLVRHCVLPEALVSEVEKDATTVGRKLGEALLALGAVAPFELQRLARRHTLDIIGACAEWTEAEYRFAAGLPNIVGELTSEIPPIEATLDHCRRRPSAATLRRIQADSSAVVLPHGALASDLARAKLSGAESYVLSRGAGSNDLHAILRDSPFEETETLSAVAALVASGAAALAPRAEPASAGRAGQRSASETAPGSAGAKPTAPGSTMSSAAYFDRMHALLIGADHYKTLDVSTSASAEEVRQAYYRLAKEIHPDRFLTPPYDILHPKMEELFAQVLEAYRTLTDRAARDRYDAERVASAQAPKPTLSDSQELARQNHLRGRALLELGKMTEAVKFLQNTVDVEPNRADYRRTLAGAQAGNPRLRKDALSNYLRAIDLEPALADNYLQAALLYGRLGEFVKAEEYLSACLKWEPENAEAKRVLDELRVAASSTGPLGGIFGPSPGT